MRRIILFALIALTATAGTAAADRYRGREHRRDRHHDRVDNRHDRVDHRRHDRVDHRHDRYDRRDRGYRHSDRRVVRDRQRFYRDSDRYVRYNGGRYTFRNGHSFHYRRPVINVRYTDYRYRPSILVENYETVPGYIWVSGRWNWTGYEWDWVPGHYEIDSNYQYNDAYYYQSPVADHDCE